MELLNRIKADQLQARKDRNKPKATVLTTLIGDITLEATRLEGMDSLQVVIKFIKDLKKTLALQDSDAVRLELGILEGYLPLQLTDVFLRNFFIDKKSQGVNHFGKALGMLKGQHSGQYDGAVASSIAKEVYK